MASSIDLSVVMPVYNESAVIGKIRCGVCDYIDYKKKFIEAAKEHYKRQRLAVRKDYVCPVCSSHKVFYIYEPEYFIADESEDFIAGELRN